ncbi:MAG: UvrD-helicase domain-containing protein [Flavobacteriales bacterium]|nr:UvrD-helicase domain-containing protein [Flavobacteriales bacterium]
MEHNLEKNGQLLIYRSSAGSGKTFTLVLNYLSIILTSDTPYKFREILAITFTNKAANEMKSRVFEHLIELAENHEDSKLMGVYKKELGLSREFISKTASKRLSSMLHNYTDVAILTIDKFAHRLIRSFSRDLNLESDFEIEMDFKKVLSECIDQLIDQVGTREDLTRLVIHHAKDKTKSDKSWKAVEDFKQVGELIQKEDTAQWIEEISKFSIDELFESHQSAVQEISKTKKAIDLESQLLIDKVNEIGIEWINYKWSGWIGFFKKAKAGDFQKLLTQEHKRLDQAIESGDWVKKTAPESIIDSASMFAEIVPNGKEKILTLSHQIQRHQIIREQIIGLGLLKEIGSIIEDYKKNNNLALISDFNKTISEIVLKQPTPFIYERIGCKFNHYFIDEFQDTSVQQWQNFIPLVDDSLAKGKINLIVGDAKQAIYRFRNGEAKQFVMLPVIYQKNNSEILEDAERTFKAEKNLLNLEFNYRSSKTVVDFNNQLFDFAKQQMGESISENYLNHKQIPAQDFEGLVEIRLNHLGMKDADQKRAFEQTCTLESIVKCKDDGFEYADITILVRKNKNGQEIADFLLEQGIPVTSSDSLKVLNNRKVQVILALLKVLENVHTQDDVIKIIAYFFTDELTEKAKELELRKTKDNGKEKLLAIIQDKFGFHLENWQSDPLYTKSKLIIGHFFQTNEQDQFVESFLENTHQFSSSKGEDISLFFEWLTEKNPSIAASENENAVQVMTIHKAKGLEFQIVILHRCDWELGPSNFSRVWTNVATGGISLNVQLHPNQNRFKVLNKDEEYKMAYDTEYLDAINLFYVAVTRPVHRLYINASSNGKKEISALLKGFLQLDDSSDYPIQWTMGTAVKNPVLEQKKTPEDFSYEPHTDMVIEIATRQHLNEEDGISEQKWGQLFHQAMDRLTHSEDIVSLTNEFVLLGKLATNEKDHFASDLKSTLEHPQLKKWLNAGHTELREREIVDELGEIYIPDRIIVLKEETILIDFKTGQPRNKDEHQITDYGHLLLDLGYSNIKKYLFYVRKSELLEVLTL